jgi:hypothetical protein
MICGGDQERRYLPTSCYSLTCSLASTAISGDNNGRILEHTQYRLFLCFHDRFISGRGPDGRPVLLAADSLLLTSSSPNPPDVHDPQVDITHINTSSLHPQPQPKLLFSFPISSFRPNRRRTSQSTQFIQPTTSI